MKRLLVAILWLAFAVSSVFGATVKLAWDARPAAENILGYNVYRSNTDGSGYVKVNTVLITGTTFDDTTVPNDGRRYFYVATAVNAGGESGYSNQVPFDAAPGVPTSLRIIP